MIRFIHTADLQLGEPFARFPEGPRALLGEARIEAFRRVVEAAAEHDAAFVLVAGDFFDAQTVPDRVLVRACDIAESSSAPIYVLPGNHDHAGPESIYRQERFLRHAPSTLVPLLEPTPLPVAEGEAVLLPAPLTRRQDPRDPTRHFDAALGRAQMPSAIRIGVAHGSVSTFGDPDIANPIDTGVVDRAELDYLALGDWHGMDAISERCFYAGTPEPDGFVDNEPGHLLLVEIDGRGATPRVTPHAIAEHRWRREEQTLTHPEDVARLRRLLESVEEPHRTVFELRLSGSLPFGEVEKLDAPIETARARFRHLRVKGEVVGAPDASELSALELEGFVGAAVNALRARVDGEGTEEERHIARRALALLHRIRVAEGGRC